MAHKPANSIQKKLLDDITDLIDDIGCGFLYGMEYEGRTDIDRHHVFGRAYKQNKVSVGHEFVIPVPKELHEVLSNHKDNVTNCKKRFTARFGMQRHIYAKLIEELKIHGYAVPEQHILDAIQATSA